MTSFSSTPSYRDSAPLCAVCQLQSCTRCTADEWTARLGWGRPGLGFCTLSFSSASPSGHMGAFGQLWTAVPCSVSLFWQACSVPLKAPIVLSGFDKSVQRGQTTSHTYTHTQAAEPHLGLRLSMLHWPAANHLRLIKSSVCMGASSACFCLRVCIRVHAAMCWQAHSLRLICQRKFQHADYPSHSDPWYQLNTGLRQRRNPFWYFC